MSEWYDNQKKPKGDYRKLLQEQIDKANPRRKEFTKEEKQKLENVRLHPELTH
jgi:hypothetical protein|tara:strand:- start:3449 stop:3607 length:159 start_codon:yes stop_codon:yes gene_type:complete